MISSPNADKSLHAQTVHRPDIDGLRAIAVLSVLAYHGNPHWLPGGFVGVDIFFVISGFLISSIIFTGLDRGTFSFADFYARRIKRIFPALALVLMFVIVVGWLVLFTDEYQSLGKHVAAGAAFLSNVALWNEAGYFDPAAVYKPLLHLWSLGIEEQFYLIWPTLFLLVSKRGVNRLLPILVITFGSFALNVMRISKDDVGTFYLPPTRFWELSLGSILAYAQVCGREHAGTAFGRVLGALCGSAPMPLPDAQACVGLLLLLVAVARLTTTDLFPSWWALLPTLGAFLLIAAGPRAWINRVLLGNRILVFVGLISYPLYLWHWPLLSFQRIMAHADISITATLVTLAVAFVLAWLTYRFVERPIRTSRLRLRPSIWLMASITGLAVLGLSSHAQIIQPRSARYGLDTIVAALSSHAYPGPHLRPVTEETWPILQQGQSRKMVLFLGDSNAEQYYPRIDWLLTRNPAGTRRVAFATSGGCPPFPGVKEAHHPNCIGIVDRGERYAQNPDVDTVVFAAMWTAYLQNPNPLYDYYYEDDTVKGPILLGSETSDRALAAFESLVSRLTRSGKKVFIILPIPYGDEFDPRRLVERSLLNLDFRIRAPHLSTPDVVARLKPIVSRLAQIARNAGATTLDPIASVCNALECPEITAGGEIVNRDGSHLNPSYVQAHIHFLDELLLLPTVPSGSPEVARLLQPANLH